MDWVAHLRVRNSQSLYDGILTDKQIAAHAKERGIGAVALMNQHHMVDVVSFWKKLTASNIHAIVGVSAKVQVSDQCSGELGLLALNREGYSQLCRLSPAIWDEDEPISLDAFLDHDLSQVALLTGAAGTGLGYRFCNGDAKQRRQQKVLDKLASGFDGRMYVEVTREDTRDYKFEDWCSDVASRYSLPTVATGNVCCLDAKDAELVRMRQQVVYSDADQRPSNFGHLRSADEMRSLYADIPWALENARQLSVASVVDFAFSRPLFPVPRHFRNEADEQREVPVSKLHEELVKRAYKGALERLNEQRAEGEEPARELPEVYRDRLDGELQVLQDKGFAGYFLVVQEIIDNARETGILVGPGRGSAAGSLVAWALRITQPDPIVYGLYFERFLNPERGGMPDIDVDVNPEGRDKLIQQIVENYGQDRVSQIGTVGTLASRAAIDAVGKIMKQPYGLLQRIKEMIPTEQQLPVSLEKALQSDAFRTAYREDAEIARVVDVARSIEGVGRAFGKHAGGVLISTVAITDHIPVRMDDGSMVSQLDKDTVEHMGFIKFDFLGLTNLTTIEKTVERVSARAKDPDAKRREITAALEALDDAKTFKLLSRGKSYAVFQIEAPDVQQYLPRYKPKTFTDLVLLGALIRPGARQAEEGKALQNIAKRRDGKMDPLVIHETLSDILADSQGSIVYQEQVMGIAQKLAGYSLAEADNLRRFMSKRKESDGMGAELPVFIKRAQEVSQLASKDAEAIFEDIANFAKYGFNKSHALAYAIVTFQTAYLKQHYPDDYMAMAMSQEGSLDNVPLYSKELQALKCKLLLPCINNSEVETAGNGKNEVRLGLGDVLQLGKGVCEWIVEEREAGGDFKSLRDFLERTQPDIVNDSAFRCLIEAGTFDALPYNTGKPPATRASLHQNSKELVGWMRERQSMASSSQGSLFGAADTTAEFPPDVNAPAARFAEVINERRRLGTQISGRLLDLLKPRLKAVRLRLAETPQNMETRMLCEIARAYGTGNNRRSAWRADLEDSEGKELSVRSNAARQLSGVKQPSLRERLIYAEGMVSRREIEANIALGEDELSAWPVLLHLKIADGALDDGTIKSLLDTLELSAEGPNLQEGWKVQLHANWNREKHAIRLPDFVVRADLRILDQIEHSSAVADYQLHFGIR